MDIHYLFFSILYTVINLITYFFFQIVCAFFSLGFLHIVDGGGVYVSLLHSYTFSPPGGGRNNYG